MKEEHGRNDGKKNNADQAGKEEGRKKKGRTEGRQRKEGERVAIGRRENERKI